MSICKNTMQEVAALYDKRLGEGFRIESNVHKVTALVRFTQDGIQYYDKMCDKWFFTDGFLKELLSGKAVILD